MTIPELYFTFQSSHLVPTLSLVCFSFTAAENRAGSGSNEGEKERKSATDKERKTSSSNKKHSQQQPPTKPSGMDVKLVRNNVARSLKDILWQRCEDSREFALDEAQVQRLAKKIERQLYLLHDGTGQKYKAKYRTLMFNLKDQRNRVSHHWTVDSVKKSLADVVCVVGRMRCLLCRVWFIRVALKFRSCIRMCCLVRWRPPVWCVCRRTNSRLKSWPNGVRKRTRRYHTRWMIVVV